MRDATIAFTFCLHVGIVFSKVLPQPCQSTKDGLCGKGQYLLSNKPHGHSCADCPENTFIDYDSHVCEQCKGHTQPNSKEIIARIGDRISDNVILCKAGFYKTSGSSKETNKCESCSVCRTGTWTARECTSESDTVCCPNGMTAVGGNDDVVCVLNLSPGPQMIQAGRQERSQVDSSGNNSTDLVATDEVSSEKNDKLSKNVNEESEDNTHLIPKHSYVYEEQKREMVEFPIWARFLCAGIAVGIFLFYLGVGIPCNACGSLDKLRHLKGLISKRNDSQSAEEDSKHPINPKSSEA